MSILVPCELSGLAALYETRKHTLIITAKGEAPDWYLGPFIQQVTPWLGGLKFSLLAYPGGLDTSGKMVPFDVRFELPVILPNRAVIGKNVVIATANNPHGFVVPIRYTGLKEGDEPTVITTEDADAPNLSVVLPPITIVVPGEGVPFHITAAADVGPHGGVRVSYNKRRVKMDDASLDGKIINWTFAASALGETLIEVTTSLFSEAHPVWTPLTKIQPYLVKVVVTKEDSA